jgi:histidinol phosphatase-like PHP family hydrolase
MPRAPKTTRTDINATIAGLLQDLAAVQTIKPKTQAFQGAAEAVFGLAGQLDQIRAAGPLPRIPGVGPSSLRVVEEVLKSGTSATVAGAVAASGKQADIDRRRGLRAQFFSRAEVVRILGDQTIGGVSPSDCRADFQMHSEWSDGAVPLSVLARACADRGYTHMAVTDHAQGLRIARGMSMADAVRQHREIDDLNAKHPEFSILKGLEANLGADGTLDFPDEDLARFDLVLAAPHAQLRIADDQTPRLLRALETPNVHILAHPRGRKMGARAGIVADWDAVFARAAKQRIAIEIDGDPMRQDLDWTMATRALEAGCLFALDSDAHAPDQLIYAETAIAHARLAGIPANRIVNCWPLAMLRKWARERQR